jgi:MFS transporter, FSR family, fosmidomycin resistance protein
VPVSERGWLDLDTRIWKIASTHLVVDAYTNMYAPLLPLLIPHLGMSLATAGTLAMCFQMANSVSQLGFGALADRWKPRALILGGPLAAVLILSFIGLSSSTWMLGAILVFGGLGGAAFHPPAAALVYRIADHRKGLAMSAHISGGSIGFALAPLVFVPLIARIGLAWSPVIMFPGLLALSWTLRQVPPMTRPAAHERSSWASLKPAAVPLTLVYFTVVLRTATSYGFMTFAPTLLTRRGLSIDQASSAVFLYLLTSSIGGFFGGPLADRFGARAVMVATLVASVPFLAIAPVLSPWGFTAMLAIGGLLLQSTLPVSVTYAQSVTKAGAATVSSLMMGFAWGMGSLAVPIIGFSADRAGINATLVGLSAVPLLAAALAAALPEPPRSPVGDGSPGGPAGVRS